MEKLDFNVILNREHIVKQIKDILNHFEENKKPFLQIHGFLEF